MKISQIFINLIIIKLFLSLVKVDTNTPIQIEFLENKLSKFNGLKIFMGNSNNYQEIEVRIVPVNFGFSKIILSDIEKMNKGIECKDGKNTCKKRNNEKSLGSYNSSSFIYNDAEIFFRFKINQKIDKKGKKVDFLLMEDNIDKWPFYLDGVLGLSPQSEFGNYLRNNFQDDISFIFHFYYEKNDLIKTDLLDIGSDILMNPSIAEGDKLIQIDFDNKKNFWDFKANFEIENTDVNLKNLNICITNSFNDLIILKDDKKLCDSIKKIACDNKIGNDCKKKNVNFKKLPKLIFILENKKKLEFLAKDYIYFTKENVLECRFGNIENLKSFGTCDKNSEFAVGKVFLSKFYPVFVFNKDKTSSLIFLDFFKFHQKSVYWINIVFVFFLIISPFFYVLLKKKRKSDRDVYSRV